MTAVAVLQMTGCCQHCQCCRNWRIFQRDNRKDPLPPPDVMRNVGPLPTRSVTPASNPQPTGAYGGS
jgi:pyruvate-formate lyase-activating enzyme